jgi:hypothetical protein
MRPMDEHDWLAERFEADRTHLRAVAYRLLGSVSEADDSVQEPERISGARRDGPRRLTNRRARGTPDRTRTGRPQMDRPVR